MRVADDVFIILFPITIVLIFIIGVCLLGNGIHLIYKKVNEEEELHRKLEGLVSIINGILADPFSRISIVILLGGLLTLSSLFFILDMLEYIEIE